MAESNSYCAACGLEIEDIEEIVIAGKSYHPKCNRCQKCYKPLTGKPVQIHQGKLYDEKCFFANFAKVCDICKTPIVGVNVKFLACGEKFFHQACYVCYTCQKSLQGVQYYVVRGRKVCIDCGGRLSSSSSRGSTSSVRASTSERGSTSSVRGSTSERASTSYIRGSKSERGSISSVRGPTSSVSEEL